MRIDEVSTPVLILQLDHHGALGIVRSLGRLGVRVYGVHSSDRAPAFRSRYCRRGFIWDLDATSAAESVSYLRDLADRIGRRPILLPSNDESAILIAEHQDRLRGHFIFPVNSAGLVRALFDKQEMGRLAMRAGVPTAKSYVPVSRNDVARFCRTASFPVVLKASDGIAVSRRTGKKIVIARTEKELMENYEEMADPAGTPDLILQEYIPGDDASSWMFNGYFDENSECLFGLTGRKIHENPVYAGITSLGICQHNETIDRLTRRFIRRIGYRGIVDIDYRYDARDGLYKVLDVNPRIGATFRLFVGDNGMDVVRAMYLDVTGQTVPFSRPYEDRKWVVEDLELSSCIHYFRDRAFSVPEWFESLRGIREAGWFASDDLKPFGHMCGMMIARAFRKASRYLTGKPSPKPVRADRPGSAGGDEKRRAA